jgi:hypothetical protein
MATTIRDLELVTVAQQVARRWKRPKPGADRDDLSQEAYLAMLSVERAGKGTAPALGYYAQVGRSAARSLALRSAAAVTVGSGGGSREKLPGLERAGISIETTSPGGRRNVADLRAIERIQTPPADDALHDAREGARLSAEVRRVIAASCSDPVLAEATVLALLEEDERGRVGTGRIAARFGMPVRRLYRATRAARAAIRASAALREMVETRARG